MELVQDILNACPETCAPRYVYRWGARAAAIVEKRQLLSLVAEV